MKQVPIVISIDGACSGNPGPGGWAAILHNGSKLKEISGFCEHTTNNKMELTALLEAVKILKVPCDIIVRTDSQYVCTGISNAREWSARGWKTKSGGRCANYELWQLLSDAKTAGGHTIRYQYVKGHSGDPDNEKCDRMAKDEIKKIGGV